MERVGACVSDGIVVNVIVFNDQTRDQLADMFDFVEETTNMASKPSIGWSYSPTDGFRPPQPFISWIFVDGEWVPPIPCPDPSKQWEWIEETQEWVLADPAADWDAF